MLFDQIIVVDSSDIPLKDDVYFEKYFSSALFGNTQLLYLHTSPGLPYQRNCGIKKNNGDVVYFFDDDIIANPAYLQMMQTTFEKHPEYGGGMGALANVIPKQSYYSWISRLFLLADKPGGGTFTAAGMPTMPYGSTIFKEVKVLNGCAAYRRAVFKKHQFDEQLIGYAVFEDCDMAKRVSRDYRLFYQPVAVLDHKESSAARDSRVAFYAQYFRNYSYLFFKNFYPESRWRVFAYLWAVCGLFGKALLSGNGQALVGYVRAILRR